MLCECFCYCSCFIKELWKHLVEFIIKKLYVYLIKGQNDHMYILKIESNEQQCFKALWESRLLSVQREETFFLLQLCSGFFKSGKWRNQGPHIQNMFLSLPTDLWQHSSTQKQKFACWSLMTVLHPEEEIMDGFDDVVKWNLRVQKSSNVEMQHF